MRPARTALWLAPAAFVIVGLSASAQDGGNERRGRERADPRAETVTVRTEQELKILIETPAMPNLQCEAVATTNYNQRNTLARVESTIKIADCTKASGELTVSVRIRDASGEIKPLEFNAPWQRSDDADVSFTADYPIGENVDLMSVRVRGLRCTCADAAETAAAD